MVEKKLPSPISYTPGYKELAGAVEEGLLGSLRLWVAAVGPDNVVRFKLGGKMVGFENNS